MLSNNKHDTERMMLRRQPNGIGMSERVWVMLMMMVRVPMKAHTIVQSIAVPHVLHADCCACCVDVIVWVGKSGNKTQSVCIYF